MQYLGWPFFVGCLAMARQEPNKTSLWQGLRSSEIQVLHLGFCRFKGMSSFMCGYLAKSLDDDHYCANVVCLCVGVHILLLCMSSVACTFGNRPKGGLEDLLPWPSISQPASQSVSQSVSSL